MAVAQQFLAAAARHGVGLAAVADEHEQRAVAAGPGELGAQPLAVREQIDPGVFAQAGQVGAVAGLLLVIISTRRGGVRRGGGARLVARGTGRAGLAGRGGCSRFQFRAAAGHEAGCRQLALGQPGLLGGVGLEFGK